MNAACALDAFWDSDDVPSQTLLTDESSVTPMTRSEANMHITDFDNCIDVPVTDVSEDEITELPSATVSIM